MSQNHGVLLNFNLQWLFVIAIVGLVGCSSSPIDLTKLRGEIITWQINTSDQIVTWKVEPLDDFSPLNVSFEDQILINNIEIAIALSNVNFSGNSVSFDFTIKNIASNKVYGLGQETSNFTFPDLAAGATNGLEVITPAATATDLGGDGFLTSEEVTQPLNWKIDFSGVENQNELLEYAFVVSSTIETLTKVSNN